HAFRNDKALSEVKFDASVTTLGLAPFRINYYNRDGAATPPTYDLAALRTLTTNVDFQDSTRFKTDNGIIYSLDDSGNKNALIEFLPGRSAGTVQPSETKGVTAISEEAFADTRVNVVTLDNASFSALPARAFEDTPDLVSVTLPQSCEVINDYAFKGSNIKNLTVMCDDLDWTSNGLDLVRTTMTDPTNDSTDHGVSEGANSSLTVYAPAETDGDGNVTTKSRAYSRFENHHYFMQAYKPIKHYYVTYYDYKDANATKATLEFTDEYVEGDQVILRDPIMDADNKHSTPGFAFEYYYNLYDTEETYDYRHSFTIGADLTVVAKYKGLNESYTAIFYDTDPDTGATGAALMMDVPVLTTDDNGTTKYYINPNQIAYLAPTEKSGYSFQTWQKIDPRNGALFTLDQVEEKDGVIKFYAKYTSGSGGGENSGGGGTVGPGQYKVTYYLPDGTLYQTWGIDPGGTAYDLVVPNYSRSEWKWSPDVATTVINSDTRFVLVPADGADPDATNKYTATYYYTDGVTVYQTLSIEKDSTPPDLMMPDGYKNCKWSPDPSSVTMDKNMRFTMVKNPDYSGDDDYTGPYYTLTVVNGNGSGSYKPGAQVVIVANDPKTGTKFNSWTVSPDTTALASKALSATVLTMPAENVTVTANYVAGNSGGNVNYTGGSGTTGGRNVNPGTITRSSGTTVVIDKNGLSNTGVVSATVNGSSDNFTIKVTENSAAAESVLRSLLTEYGSVEDIEYFPMDISLYDAAGTKKILDTTGLTVTVTLPLPDSLKDYAGNNKVAGVIDNRLDVLSPRFSTISGVPCVTFTCTHFSPYVIYVNKVQMTAGGDPSGRNPGAYDNTPKTGDIHPKWFLSIGLLAMSLVLFLMKDKKPAKVKSAK
nr:leucine-rich repeat protein [Lachnospiraceae bacterium]